MKENKNLDTNVRPKDSRGNAHQKDTTKTDFSIVGIGAFTGGLEALSTFVDNVPENSALAFVIVSHMEKLSKTILVDLLQSATTMKVVQVYDNISVERDCVYVIPPNKNMSIKHNVLHLFDHIEPPTLHLTIDFFF